MDSMAQPPAVRVLVFGAAARADSLNGRLAALAGEVIARHGAQTDLATMREFAMPVYDGDLEAADGVPPGAVALRDRIAAASAFVIASPEYNASMPGILKNAIDWVSRVRPQPFKDKHAMLLSASPSLVGGNRGLWTLRVPLEHLGTRVYPDMFSLARAHEAFTADGHLADAALQQRLEDTLTSFLGLVEADTRYVCLQRRWYEFLGEQTDSLVTQRAEE